MPEPTLPNEVTSFYNQVPEEDRLATGPSQLEFARTKEIIGRYLPPAPSIVVDVGGAAGAYSLWLAELGYRVHLVDAVPRLVAVAERRSAQAVCQLASCHVGDARRFPFGDSSADSVLLLGPLYHLTDSGERLQALREAHRILRDGGVVFAAAISRCGSALDGIARDLFADPRFASIVQQDLEKGQHRNETGKLEYFTTAYFHHPVELRNELTAAGFNCHAVLGIEGPGWILSDFDQRWADPRKRADLLAVARMLENESSIIGLSAHLLAVGTK